MICIQHTATPPSLYVRTLFWNHEESGVTEKLKEAERKGALKGKRQKRVSGVSSGVMVKS